MNADKAWEAAVGQLQVEMPKGTFDTWVAPLAFFAYEDGQFVIRAPSAYTLDWVNNRLKSTVTRLLTGMMNRTVEVQFVLLDTPSEEAKSKNELDSEEKAPLNHALEQITRATATFDELSIWSGNKIAIEVAKQVAKSPGKTYNPVFMHGGPGLGKTTLLKAVASVLKARGDNILYVSAEELVNDFTSSILKKGMQSFREKYRTLDALLVDDFHRLEGKKKTQEEFINIFNVLYEKGKLIVIASNKAPKDMELDATLASRMFSGIVIPLDAPNTEAKVQILKRMADEGGNEIPLFVLEQIAQTVDPDLRMLRGALNMILAQKNLLRVEPSVNNTNRVLEDFTLTQQEQRDDPMLVVGAVAKEFGVTVEILTSSDRRKPVARARQVVMYLLHEHSKLSLLQIGKVLSRNHTTIIYGVESIEELITQDPSMKQKVEKLAKQLYEVVPVRV